MQKKNSILIIDKDLNLCELMHDLFEHEGFHVEYTLDGNDGLDLLREQNFDVVVCDFRLRDFDGLELLKRINSLRPYTQILIVTAYTDVRIAVKAMRMGAFDYIAKPIIPDELVEKVREALSQSEKVAVRNSKDSDRKPRHSKVHAGPEHTTTSNGSAVFLGKSPLFQKALSHIELVGPTDMTVIVQGDTGSGKEVVSRLIHKSSDRRDQPFVALDCGAIPDELVASELFGHVKGSFTGAFQDKDGIFVQANGGTLFLDEIGNLSYEIQVQLLRVLQEREVRRVGDIQSIPVDIRLIAATHEDLRKMVEEGKFREDLYYRLNEFKLLVPNLSERREDIPGFLEFFLDGSNRDLGKQIEGFDPRALDILQTYAWPGNLREMKNVVKRATLVCQGKRIGEKDLPPDLLLNHTVQRVNDAFTSNRPPGRTVSPISNQLEQNIRQAEVEAIMEALQSTNFNRTKAARKLQIDRKTLYNKMKTYNIQV